MVAISPVEITLSQPLLEEGGDVVGDAVELLVAVCLCGLETTGDMAANEGHGHGVRWVGHGDSQGLLGLERARGEDGIGREDERTRGLS